MRERSESVYFVLAAMILTALAAGMGWGIRGQYGHESGAMIAGALASLTLVMLFVPNASSLVAIRAAAMMTVAIGIGGSMTYGQTIGLTQNGPVLGNTEALRWGLLGLFIKGGIWIAFGGLFLGMGLGGKRYRPVEMAILMPLLLGLMFLGVWLINKPYDPSQRLLPAIYFSADWYFEPDALDLKPRFEVWGGLLVSLLGFAAYSRFVRGDRLAGRMTLIGFLAGGLGFSLGQCVQAYHAWHPEVFQEGGTLGRFADTFGYFNWWNMMETTFGMVWGGVIALGLWLNRHLIVIPSEPEDVTIRPEWEITLCVIHLILLTTAEFLTFPAWGFDPEFYIENGLVMSTLPLIGILGGRLWPYLMVLPVLATPIVGKTLKNLAYDTTDMTVSEGWLWLVAIPVGITTCVGAWLIAAEARRQPAGRAAAIALFCCTCVYFGLNTVFFRGAWPWHEWTGRTPNQTIFSVCAVTLLIAAVYCFSGSASRATGEDQTVLK